MKISLIEIENKSKSIINLGKQLYAISTNLFHFDLLIIAALNRTVNTNKAFVSLVKDSNFISAIPLIRINIDTLLRLYASKISEFNRNEYALKILSGTEVKKMKHYNSKSKLSDYFLHTEISKIEGMEWVSHLYNIGNSFIHFEKSHFLSSMKITSEDDRTISMSIGYHDSFISDNDKKELVNWMNLTIDKIVEQTQIWILEKCEALNFDIEKLNEL
ncbi:hypothetical protein OAX38_02710 [Flavobacteriaceae bacterium]|nr:hypothetical protein [Flavobacteriaceae bacterium]